MPKNFMNQVITLENYSLQSSLTPLVSTRFLFSPGLLIKSHAIELFPYIQSHTQSIVSWYDTASPSLHVSWSTLCDRATGQ